MRFAFTDEQIAFRDAFRSALAEACPPSRVRAAWTARDDELVGFLGGIGVLGVEVPEDQGGLGLGPLEWVLLHEEAGRVALPMPFIEATAALPALAATGADGLAAAAAAGEALVSVGQDFVVDGDAADLILVLHGGQLCRVDDPVLRPHQSVDGARRLFTVDGPRTPLAGVDAGTVFNRAALAAAAQLIGLSRTVLEMGVDYAKARRQFGKPIGSFQAVQHHLVDALLAVSFAEPAVHAAAWALAMGAPDVDAQVSMAKAMASDAAQVACRKSLQVHGAIGYTYEYDLHMFMKRCWALREAWGSAAWHRARIAETLLEDADA